MFPWGIVTVNVVGSAGRWAFSPRCPRPAGGDGGGGRRVRGALTTYSTFGYETVRLAGTGARRAAAGNVAVSIGAGLGAAYAGLALGAPARRDSVLGGSTTFSTHLTGIQRSLDIGAAMSALAYLAATLIAALAAFWTGISGMRVLTRRIRPPEPVPSGPSARDRPRARRPASDRPDRRRWGHGGRSAPLPG